MHLYMCVHVCICVSICVVVAFSVSNVRILLLVMIITCDHMSSFNGTQGQRSTSATQSGILWPPFTRDLFQQRVFACEHDFCYER